jgi:hypothetical protein
MSATRPDPGYEPEPELIIIDEPDLDRPMSRFELHAVFREAVRWELSRGRLSKWRRKRLVQYAAALRISAVEAGQLIQEAVQAEYEADRAAEPDAPQLRLVSADPPGWPTWAKLATALAVVLAVKLTLVLLMGS